MAEVWAAVGEPGSGFVTGLDEIPWSTPGLVSAAMREEARARAEERREAEELAEKVDARRNAAMVLARDYAVRSGQPWSPADPWATWPSQDVFTEMIFAEQDRQSRRDDRAALIQAGLLHVIGPADLYQASPAPEVSQTSPPVTPAVRARPIATRIRRAVAGWAQRSTPASVERPREISRHRGAITDGTISCGREGCCE